MSIAPSDEQKQFLYLLSRADTLHDFVGERSVLSKEHVIKLLDGISELNNFQKLKKNLEDVGDIDNILKKSEAALVGLELPKHYPSKIVKRIKEIKRYEPRVVLFYELYAERLGLGNKIGRYVSYDYLPGYDFKDRKYTLTNDDTIDESVFQSANIAYINLGTTAKEKTGRKASGIYLEPTLRNRYNALYDVLKQFYTGKSQFKFVVDTSIVSFEELGITNAKEKKEQKKIKTDYDKLNVVCNIASDWDSAGKTSVCTPDDKATRLSHVGEGEGIYKRSIFGLSSIELENNNGNDQVTLDKGNKTLFSGPLNHAIVEVTPLSQLVENKGPWHKTVKLEPSELFDIKRSGDAFQVLMTQQLNAAAANASATAAGATDTEYIFVTIDHLAFLKARLNGIPAMFTAKDSMTDDRLIFMYKPEIKKELQYTNLKTLFDNRVQELTNYQNLSEKTTLGIDEFVAKFLGTVEVSFTSSISFASEMAKNPSIVGEVISRYINQNGSTFDIKQFDELLSIEKALITLETIFAKITLTSKVTTNNDLGKFLKIIQKTVPDLKTQYQKIISHTFLIELFHKCTQFLQSTPQKIKGEYENLARLTNDTQQLINAKTQGKVADSMYPISSIQDAIRKIDEFISKYAPFALSSGTTMDALRLRGIDIDAYIRITKSISSTINSKIYSPRGITVLIKKYEMSSSSRKDGAYKELAMYVQKEIWEKTLSTLVSFAQQQVCHLEIDSRIENVHNRWKNMVEELKNSITRGGGSEDGSEDGMPEMPAASLASMELQQPENWLEFASKLKYIHTVMIKSGYKWTSKCTTPDEASPQLDVFKVVEATYTYTDTNNKTITDEIPLLGLKRLKTVYTKLFELQQILPSLNDEKINVKSLFAQVNNLFEEVNNLIQRIKQENGVLTDIPVLVDENDKLKSVFNELALALDNAFEDLAPLLAEAEFDLMVTCSRVNPIKRYIVDHLELPVELVTGLEKMSLLDSPSQPLQLSQPQSQPSMQRADSGVPESPAAPPQLPSVVWTDDDLFTYCMLVHPTLYLTANIDILKESFKAAPSPPPSTGGNNKNKVFTLKDYHERYYKLYADLYY
jgi:SepF-like predicted cell division protein (DUF552 family)